MTTPNSVKFTGLRIAHGQAFFKFEHVINGAKHESEFMRELDQLNEAKTFNEVVAYTTGNEALMELAGWTVEDMSCAHELALWTAYGSVDTFFETYDLKLAVFGASNLSELCDVLNERKGEIECVQFDLSALPTFGGEAPRDTAEIYSWDAERELVAGEGDLFKIVPRD